MEGKHLDILWSVRSSTHTRAKFKEPHEGRMQKPLTEQYYNRGQRISTMRCSCKDWKKVTYCTLSIGLTHVHAQKLCNQNSWMADTQSTIGSTWSVRIEYFHISNKRIFATNVCWFLKCWLSETISFHIPVARKLRELQTFCRLYCVVLKKNNQFLK